MLQCSQNVIQFEQDKITFNAQKIFLTLVEKMMAAIPRGRQQQKVLKIDHPR